MAIERIIMVEGLISPDLKSPATPGLQSPEQGISPMEPNVVVSPDVRRGGVLQRLLGRGPKVEVLVEPDEVIKNASLSGQDRLKTAEGILGEPLSGKQEEGLLKAHLEGLGEEGKDKREAGIFNYTQEQIAHKARILKDAGFDKEQRRALLESGVAGLDPTEIARGPEWLTSPEKGRWLVELIVEMETKLPYEVRYNAENGPKLDGYYKSLWKFVEGISEDRNFESHFDSKKEHLDVIPTPDEPLIDKIVKAYKERITKVAVQAEQAAQATPEDLTNVEPFEVLIQKYNNAPSAERLVLKEDILKHFREANRKGLLKGTDDILNSLYLRYEGSGISAEQGRRLLRHDIVANANMTAESAVRRRLSDPEVNSRLRNVGQVYIQWAADRFEGMFDGETSSDYEKGEWHPPSEDEGYESTETYWEPSGHYPKYYDISAKTPAQFLIAKDTFLQMIKDQSLGNAPDELMDHYRSFKEKLGAVGADLALKQKEKDEGPDKMTAGFLKEIRQEFEGQFLLWYSAHNLESYHKDGWKQGMTAMALHEGPQRWTRVARSGNGEVGAYTYQFDNDPMVELAYNAQGSRGQLGGYSPAQNYMRKQIMQMMSEKGMGVVLKDYDRRDDKTAENSKIRKERALLLDKIEKLLKINGGNLDILSDEDRESYVNAKNHAKINQERIGIHQPAEAFKDLYEGFDKGDAHTSNYLRYGQLTGEQIQKLPDELRRFVTENNLKLTKEELEQLPKSLRKSIVLGSIKLQIDRFRAEARDSSSGISLSFKGEADTPLINIELAKLVELGRISKKDKKLYEEAFEKSKLNFEIADEMQGVTMEKAIRGGGVYFVYRNRFVQEYQKVKRSIGTDDAPADSALSPKQRREGWTEGQHIGWILSEIKLGKDPKTFSEYERILYNKLIPEDRKNILDQIPIHQAVKAVQAVINWTKMKYADDQDIWSRPDLKAIIHEKNSNGNYKNPNFRAIYRTAMVDKMRQLAVAQIKAKGFEANFYNFESEVIKFDPKSKKIDIRLNIDTQTKKIIGTPMTIMVPKKGQSEPERKVLNFDTAKDSYLSLHTNHTYWAYQNNNTHTLIPEYVFKQAREIKDGKRSAEDADILAGLLLTLDPTLCRVKGFAGEQMSLEGIVFDAAVESSYMSWIDARNALKEAFLPKNGNSEDMGAGYYIEDFGGEGRFALQIEALVAKMPKRWARRFAAALAITPMHVSSLADNLGRKGVLGAVSLMDDKIHKISDQRILGQFGITKFINLVDSGTELWFSLVGGIDPKTGLHHEGLFMKPTNNSDKLQRYFGKHHRIETFPEEEDEFFYALKDTFGRVEDTLKIIRKMYSDGRNSGGALNLDKTDIFLPDGRYNPSIATDRNTGTSRHVAKMFWDAYVEWLVDKGPGGGSEVYPQEAEYFAFLNQPVYYDIKAGINPPRTVSAWLFDKMAL